jgi:hypothetical protein
MSKRKPAKSLKRARSPAIDARANGKKQTVVKSATHNLLRSVAAGPIESSLELHDDPKEEAPKAEKQEAPVAANPRQVGRSQMRGFDFASSYGKHGGLSSEASGNDACQHATFCGLQPEACDEQVAIPICRRDCRIYQKAGRHVGEVLRMTSCRG